ncbi:methylated-DNA--[protein]-cysteine S-methyltransferase [Sagittula stellata]|nr:methylated-DNA--[protein]-cysteine S-methyltransferase [Sagittula stellata]
MAQLTVATPTGPFRLVEAEGVMVSCGWCDGPSDAAEATPLLREAASQLEAYFAGRLTRFDLPWFVDRSPFQSEACALMAAIPFGETITYGEMAKALGVSAQAAGRGCGGNPLPVIVPCHRVLATNGLGGFSASGGVETKVWLLRHEGAAGLLI